MKKIFDTTLQNRKLLYKILDNTPKEQLLEIPTGFRNNIWWNIAHVVVTQQLLVYKFSDLQVRVPEEYIEKFKKGTVPDGTATDDEMKEIAGFLISTADWAREDYDSEMFKEFKNTEFVLHHVHDEFKIKVPDNVRAEVYPRKRN